MEKECPPCVGFCLSQEECKVSPTVIYHKRVSGDSRMKCDRATISTLVKNDSSAQPPRETGISQLETQEDLNENNKF